MLNENQRLKDTLGYRPDIQTTKRILSDVEKMIEPEEIKISSALKDLIENLPSTTLNKADVAISKVNTAMGEIEGRLSKDVAGNISFNDYKKALDEKDYDVQNQYEEAHRNSIEGKVEAELYGQLHSMKHALEESRAMVLNENYGTSVKTNVDSDTTRQASELDRAIVSQMIASEQAGEDRINYATVYMDTAINAAMARYFNNSGQVADRVLSIIDKEPETEEVIANTKAVQSLIERSFLDEVKLNKSDVNKVRQLDRGSIRLQAQSLMYKNRNDMMNAGISASSFTDIKSNTMRSKMEVASNMIKNKSFDAVLDIGKVNNMERIYRDDLLNTVESKHSLRQFHSQLK